MTWDDYFIKLAITVAEKSKDTTKVGCVLVGPDNEIRSSGWNGLARGVNQTDERQERPAKYDWTIHAEANAVANAARAGIALKGSKAYVTHFCCKSCADILIQAGICEVIIGNGTTVGDHLLDIGLIKFNEAGVKVREL